MDNKKIFATRMSQGTRTEVFLTIPASPGEGAEQVLNGLNNYRRENPDGRVVKMTVFGSTDFIKRKNPFQDTSVDTINWPITWVGSKNPGVRPLAGIQAHTMENGGAETIKADGRIIGTVFEDPYARYCLLCNILPDDPKAGCEEQAQQVFDKWKSTLEQAGMKISNIVRTWLFLDDILSWYMPFNTVRNEFFQKEGVYNGVVPASTGVSGGNPRGAALTTDLIAIQPKTDDIKISMVPSPLQCPAQAYGSSFSRAVEFSTPEQRQLFISGTASISRDGKTLHTGRVEAQIDTTIQVIKAILQLREMDWPDVSRAIAYFRNNSDRSCFRRYCEKNRLSLPVILTQGDICRDDLLFEMELDAIKSEKAERVVKE